MGFEQDSLAAGKEFSGERAGLVRGGQIEEQDALGLWGLPRTLHRGAVTRTEHKRVDLGRRRVAQLSMEGPSMTPTERAKISNVESEIAKVQALIERVRQRGGSHPDLGSVL